MESPPALEILNLEKSFPTGFLHRDTRKILHGLTFRVDRGETFGYLGPNGSGKTTTLKVLMGIVFKDSGSVRILGQPFEDGEWRRRAGYLPEHPYFYDYLTPLEYLDYAGRLFEIEKAARLERSRRLLDMVGLLSAGRTPMRRFSKGMVQRLGLAQALMNDPEIVFLDEPMSGLDPLGRRSVRTLIQRLRDEGKTVFFSTHILADAETLCDRVAVIRGGRLLDVGALGTILNVDVTHVDVVVSGIGPEALAALPFGLRAQGEKSGSVRLEVAEADLDKALAALLGAGARVQSVQPVRQSLEDYFMKEMGGEGTSGGSTWDA
jgi:ABC-2 type transport system ATP-binding protein